MRRNHIDFHPFVQYKKEALKYTGLDFNSFFEYFEFIIKWNLGRRNRNVEFNYFLLENEKRSAENFMDFCLLLDVGFKSKRLNLFRYLILVNAKAIFLKITNDLIELEIIVPPIWEESNYKDKITQELQALGKIVFNPDKNSLLIQNSK